MCCVRTRGLADSTRKSGGGGAGAGVAASGTLSFAKKDPLCADEIVPGVEVVEITVGGGHSMLALRSFQSVMKQRKNWGYYADC